MNEVSRHLKRCLSLVLTLGLLTSNVNLGLVLRAHATDEVTVKYGKLLADNYSGQLTDEEKAVLTSGYLREESVSYTVPTDDDGLVTVDPEEKTVELGSYGEWSRPAAATLVAEGYEEPISIDGVGKGSFEYDGNAYSVKAKYTLTVTVSEADQLRMLNTAGYLAQGVEKIDELNGTKSTLVELRNQGFENALQKISNDERFGECRADAQALLDQMIANADGKLDLEAALDEYAAAASKTQYLLTSGEALRKTARDDTYVHVLPITEKLNNIYTLWDFMQNPESQVGMTKDQLGTVIDALDQMSSALDDATREDAPWTAAEAGSDWLKAGMSVDDYEALDGLVVGKTFGIYESSDVTEELFVASATVSAQTNQHVVSIKVNATVIENNAEKNLGSKTASVTLDDGTSKANVIAEIEAAINAMGLSDWGLAAGKYDVTDNREEIPDTLTEGFAFEMSYTPKQYSVSLWGETTEYYPYGWKLTLPVHDNGELAYDYTVNGTAYDQGEKIIIEKDTNISRTEAQAWEVLSVGELVADNLENANDAAKAADKVILSSKALETGSIRLRTTDDGEPYLNASRDLVIPARSSAVKGFSSRLYWIPVVNAVMSDSTKQPLSPVEQGDHSYQISAGALPAGYESLEITYILDLKDYVENEDELAALPKELKEEAVKQLKSMQTLYNINQALADNSMSFNSVSAAFEMVTNSKNNANPDKNYYGMFGSAAQAKLDAIAGSSWLSDLQTFVESYPGSDTDAAKLKYFFEQSSIIRPAVQGLSEALDVIVADTNTTGAQATTLAYVMDKMGYGAHTDKIEDIQDKVGEANNNMVAPNAMLDQTSDELYSLLTAITGRNTAAASAVSALNLVKDYRVSAPDKVSVTLKLGSETNTFTYDVDDAAVYHTLTAGEAESIAAKLVEMQKAVYGETAYVHYEYSGESLPTAGAQIVTKTYTYTAAAKVYKVYAGETEIGDYTYGGTFVLPAHADSTHRYTYTYTFEAENVTAPQGSTVPANVMKGLLQAHSDTYRVVFGRTEVNVKSENVQKITNTLNKAVADSGLVSGSKLSAAFIPIEKDGEAAALVLRICPEGYSEDALKQVLGKIGLAIVNLGYEVKLNDGTFYDKSKISVQALIDFAAGSGFGTNTLVGADGILNYDGATKKADIREMTLAGSSVLGEQTGTDGKKYLLVDGSSYRVNDTNLLGGKLMSGTIAFDEIELNLYVTMEDFDIRAEELGSVYQAVDALDDYVSIALNNGAQVDIQLKDRVYQAALAGMLAVGLVDMDSIDQVNPKDVVDYIYNLVADTLKDPTVTSTTLKNTLNSIGQAAGSSLDLYDTLSKVARNLINNGTIAVDSTATTQGGNSYKAKFTYDLKNVLGSLGLDDSILSIIKEAGADAEGISADIQVTWDKLNTKYAAAVIQVKGVSKDTLGKVLNFYTSTDALNAALENTSAGTFVILLDDVANLVLPHNTILNLNGHKANSVTVTAEKLSVLDSSWSDRGEIGTLTANGAELTLTAGKIGGVTEEDMLEGYSLVDGVVKNDYFTISKNANGDLTVTLNAENVLGIRSRNDVNARAVGLDLLYSLAVNYIFCSSISMDGNALYAVELEDLLGVYSDYQHGTLDQDAKINELLDCIKVDSIVAFVNDFAQSVLDFSAMNSALEKDGVIAEYSMTSTKWDIKLTHDTNNDRMTLGIVPGGANDAAKVTLALAGDVKDLVEELANVVKKAEVKLETGADGLNYASKVITADLSGNVDFEIDLSGDRDYAIVAAIIMANGSTVPEAVKAELQAALSDNDLVKLEEAVDKVTTSQLLQSLKDAAGKEFDGLTAALGLDGTVLVSAKNKYDLYSDVLYLIGKVVKSSMGGPQILASYKSDGVYAMDRTAALTQNVSFGGYQLKLADGNKITAKLKLALFAQHTYGGPEWTWEDDYSGAVAAFACTDDGCDYKYLATAEITSVVNADGSTTYTAKVTFGGNEYTNTKTAYAYSDDDDDGPVVSKKYPSEQFTDLDTEAWYREYTDYVISEGLMNGIGDGKFGPHLSTTRGMVVTILYRLEGSPKVTGSSIYSDVSDGHWYTDAVIWGTEAGVIKGYGNGEYGPEDNVTREQIVAIFSRYAQYKGRNVDQKADLEEYVDADKVSGWAYESMQWGVASELINGTSTTEKVLSPLDDTSRVQLAVLLTRWCKNLLK